jgi:hypothetical protein
VAPSRLEDVGASRWASSAGRSRRPRAGLKVEDPAAAAKREAESLRKRGAEVVIALVPLERPRRAPRRAADVDLVVVGKGMEDGLPQAEQVGKAYLVARRSSCSSWGASIWCCGRGRRLVDAGGRRGRRCGWPSWGGHRRPRSAARRLAEGRHGRRRLRRRQEEASAAQLQAERERLEKQKWQPPATGLVLHQPAHPP